MREIRYEVVQYNSVDINLIATCNRSTQVNWLCNISKCSRTRRQGPHVLRTCVGWCDEAQDIRTYSPDSSSVYGDGNAIHDVGMIQ
jgi:hypothetical protein